MGNTTTTMEEVFAKYRQRVNAALKSFFDELHDYDELKSPYAKEAIARIVEFDGRPAKRVRSSLAIFAYEAYGGTNTEVAEKAAITIEIIQNSFLIIDDVMDKSTMRRGGPAVHEIYRKKLRQSKHPDANHVGDMLAINVGYVALMLAEQIFSTIKGTDPEAIRIAQHLLNINTARTALGQVEDLYNNKYNLLSEDEILEILTNKSSYYTFVSPLQVGAALAGCKEEQVKALKNFGVPAGLMFQLRDDILGLFGDEAATGKPNTADAKEGKITILIRHALDNTNEQDRDTLLETLGNQDADDESIERLRDIVKSAGSLDYANSMCRRYIDDANKELSNLEIDDKAKQFLGDFMDYVATRHQ